MCRKVHKKYIAVELSPFDIYKFPAAGKEKASATQSEEAKNV